MKNQPKYFLHGIQFLKKLLKLKFVVEQYGCRNNKVHYFTFESFTRWIWFTKEWKWSAKGLIRGISFRFSFPFSCKLFKAFEDHHLSKTFKITYRFTWWYTYVLFWNNFTLVYLNKQMIFLEINSNEIIFHFILYFALIPANNFSNSVWFCSVRFASCRCYSSSYSSESTQVKNYLEAIHLVWTQSGPLSSKNNKSVETIRYFKLLFL